MLYLPLTVLVVALYIYHSLWHRSSLLLSFYNFAIFLGYCQFQLWWEKSGDTNSKNYKMIVCLPQVCHCMIIQHVLLLRPLQNVPIRSPTFGITVQALHCSLWVAVFQLLFFFFNFSNVFILAVRKWHKLFKIP
jgi:hypothetical protein